MGDAFERRSRFIGRVQALLHRRGFPYLQMTLLVAATGLSGFLASAALRAAGLSSMGFRYPLSVGIAWICFFGLIGLWVLFHRRTVRRNPPTIGAADLIAETSDNGESVIDVLSEMSLTTTRDDSSGEGISSGKGGGRSGSGLGDVDGDGMALVVVILIVVAVIAGVVASLYVIFEAPVLLAEVLVDGALLAGVARSLRRRTPTNHWTTGVLRRTWKAALTLLVIFTLVGIALDVIAPDATTMGEALRMASN